MNRIASEEIEKLDVTKLHSEVNQLRNLELLTCSFAVAILGASIGEVSKSPLIAIGVLVLMIVLCLWHRTLTDVRSRITTYLIVFECSEWERRYRQFADARQFPSQRRAATLTFLSLGIVAGAASLRPLIENYASNTSTQVPYPNSWFWILGGTIVAYIVIVAYWGLGGYKDKLKVYSEEWKDQRKIELDSLRKIRPMDNTEYQAERE